MHLVYVHHLPGPCTLVHRATACVGVGVRDTCGAVLEIMDGVILPVEVKEDLIQRLKRPPLSRNRFRYVNTQLPRVAIPSDMANKATLSLYSSIAQCSGNGHDAGENGEGHNSRSIKYYASEKYNKLRNKLLSDELKKDMESGRYLVSTSMLAMQEHIYELKKASLEARNYNP